MLKHLLDKILFTIGVLLFIQLPHFVDQYSQRLGGYYESRQQQLQEFQRIAQNNYNGDLQLMIEKFDQSNDPAVSETASTIQMTVTDTAELKAEDSALHDKNTFNRVVFLITHLRIDIAKSTISTFKPGIPLTLSAFAYGLVGGILFSLLFNGLCKTPKMMRRKKNSQFKPSH